MPETPSKRDLLSTIDIIVRMGSVLFIPIVIILIGNSYNRQQKELEQIRSSNESRANRLTVLLNNFASDSPRERKLAVVVASYLAEHDQLPGELVRVLAETAESDSNKEVSNAAYKSLAAVAGAGKGQAPAATAILRDLPGRIYIQVPDRNRMALARQIDTVLSVRNYQVLPVEVVTVPVKRSEVRYFHTADREEAEKIAGFLNEKGIRIAPALVRGFEGRVRNRQFEIWIAGN